MIVSLTSKCCEHVLVSFVFQGRKRQNQVAEGEDKHHGEEEDGPAVHHDEGEYEDPGCRDVNKKVSVAYCNSLPGRCNMLQKVIFNETL